MKVSIKDIVHRSDMKKKQQSLFFRMVFIAMSTRPTASFAWSLFSLTPAPKLSRSPAPSLTNTFIFFIWAFMSFTPLCTSLVHLSMVFSSFFMKLVVVSYAIAVEFLLNFLYSICYYLFLRV